jgi:predicted O-methyltransferase YrrM
MGISDSKLLRLFSVLANDPAEFLERSRMIAGVKLSFLEPVRPIYAIADWKSVEEKLSEYSGFRFKAALEEAELAALASRLRQRMKALTSQAPFGVFHNGDAILAKLCYAIVRTIQPKKVAETGVCYGVTSAHLLTALERNGKGHLYSVDLPPLGKNGDDYVGWLVPEELRNRWTLQRGTSRRLLGPMLKEMGNIDVFVHDSLHTYRNMKMEFQLVWPKLSPGGVIIADDIEGNAAFQELARCADVAFHAVVQEQGKDSLAGVLVKAAPQE